MFGPFVNFARFNAADAASDDDQAVLQVVSIWLNRLQLISVVTTFFAGMDGTFLGFTAPFTADKDVSDTSQLVHASLAGALVFHLFAAIISYIASFALIRFQLVDAEGNEVTQSAPPGLPKAEAIPPSASTSTTSSRIRVSQVRLLPFSLSPRPSRPHPQPPIPLLLWVHTVCIALSSLGFVLAVLGVMSYVWTALASAVKIFTTVCLGVSFAALGSVLF
ncbi:hypothetical protein NEOLEDRAFT_1181970 [Neolentinus lepideus HHB14362 ss-1]|uniref:Transmembrane protein n=1 Tax=Neolentinus lepideus HHB14362 ss-1 TaxID=1314782 RepID=A0A165PH73_9AGAM|nr:hypothetical protein NEOLEDRAFT_1181970 [Neolentinus lepideus HHB14362 ss-1]